MLAAKRVWFGGEWSFRLYPLKLAMRQLAFVDDSSIFARLLRKRAYSFTFILSVFKHNFILSWNN